MLAKLRYMTMGVESEMLHSLYRDMVFTRSYHRWPSYAMTSAMFEYILLYCLIMTKSTQ